MFDFKDKWSLTGLVSLILFDLIASVAAVVGVYAYFSEAEDRKLNRVATVALAKEMLYVRLDRNRNNKTASSELSEVYRSLRDLGVQTKSIDLSDLSFLRFKFKASDSLVGRYAKFIQCGYKGRENITASIYLNLKSADFLNCRFKYANLLVSDFSKGQPSKIFKFEHGAIFNSNFICGRDVRLVFQDTVLKDVKFQYCKKSQILMKRVQLMDTDINDLGTLELEESCVADKRRVNEKIKIRECSTKELGYIKLREF